MTTGERQPDWRSVGKCNQLSTKDSDALFFPPPGGKSKKAEEFCEGTRDGKPCPALKDCLIFALAPGTVGFWAGSTERYRKEMREHREEVLAFIPPPINETLPKEPTRRSRRLRPVNSNTPERTFDLVEGPSFVEELKMLG
jgi:hypothetical protein